MHKNFCALRDRKAVIRRATGVLRTEAGAVKDQIRHLGSEFVRAVEIMLSAKGRIAVMGVGKSGLIGKKISATLASTGTPSFFIHPAEGVHGDLGMIQRGDVVLALSFSGHTEELERILPALKSLGIRIITITGRHGSRLASMSDCVIRIFIREEACPYNVIPTASTTAMLALGDALSVVLLDARGIKKDDIARFHPGGIIGKRLLLRVDDLMHTGAMNPLIREDKTVRDALLVMTKTRTGAVSVVDGRRRLKGYFTDGDLRRALQKNPRVLSEKMSCVMKRGPFVVRQGQLAVEALGIMQNKKCDNLPVVDRNGICVGIIDERDLLEAGL